MRWEASSSARRELCSGRAALDKTKKAQEIVRALVGSATEEGDIVVACDSKSQLWKDVALKRAMQHWNMKYVDIARSPVSALRVFTSSERLANQMKISEIGEARIGKLVKKSEMGDPKAGRMRKFGKLVQKSEMGDPKAGRMRNFGKLVQKIEMSYPKTGKLVKKNEMGDPKV